MNFNAVKGQLYVERVNDMFRLIVERHNPRTYGGIVKYFNKYRFLTETGMKMSTTNLGRMVRRRKDFDWSYYRTSDTWKVRYYKDLLSEVNLDDFATFMDFSRHFGWEGSPSALFRKTAREMGYRTIHERVSPDFISQALVDLYRKQGAVDVDVIAKCFNALGIGVSTGKPFRNGWELHRFLTEKDVDRHAVYEVFIRGIITDKSELTDAQMVDYLNQNRYYIPFGVFDDIHRSVHISNRKWTEERLSQFKS